jgi:hypothetical protein
VRRPQHPSPCQAVFDAGGPDGVPERGEPRLRSERAGRWVLVRRAPLTIRVRAPGWCLTRKCSRQAEAGRDSERARRSLRPNKGSVD